MTDSAWQPLWDSVFADREWGKYPPEDLIRFIARNFYRRPDRRDVKILELGCGPGANIWYLAREGFAAFGIDGSKVAIERATARLAGDRLAASLTIGDINDINRIYHGQTFDAVIDVGCLVCFTAAGQAGVIGQVHNLLKPGGRVFSRLFARGSWGDGLGVEVEPGTFDAITAGPLAGVGRVRFCTPDGARRLFAGFRNVAVERSSLTYDGGAHEMINLIVTAEKE